MANNRCKNKNNPYFMAIDQEFILNMQATIIPSDYLGGFEN